jgi:hypothetical protein
VTFTKQVSNIVHYKHMFVVINHTINIKEEENAQSNGKQGANLLDEVVVLEKQTCQFPDHCSRQGGDKLNWSVESPH